MGPTETEINEEVFNINFDCTEYYGDVAEQDPSYVLDPLFKPVSKSFLVDYDHGSNVVTRSSYLGILLFVCDAIIKFFI